MEDKNTICPAGFVSSLTHWQEHCFAKAHAKEALNFQITMALAAVISGILILVIIGILGIIAVSICTIVFSILAAMAASRDEEYRYPVSLRFIK